MIQDVALALAFLVTTTIAATIVPSLPLPLAFLPLMLATGLLVMHRVGSIPGALWIVLGAGLVQGIGAVQGELLPACIGAIGGAVLVERVFASRSVYALLGLGLSAGGLVALAAIAGNVFAHLTGAAARNFGSVAGQSAWELLLLVMTLYAGFVLTSWLRRVLTRLFVIRTT